MIDIPLLLIGIAVLFGIFIVLRSILSLQVCALCGATSLTWITLLTLFYFDYATDPIFIALLMGGSVVGSMYLLEQKLPEKYQIFKLPYFLTLVSAAYFVIVKNVTMDVMMVLGTLWLIIFLIHAGKRVKKIRGIGRKIIECCKNW